MSTHAVLPKQVTVEEHPNADALDVIRIDGYQCVSQKGLWKTGDWALYIPEQSILPDPLIEEMGLTGFLAGKEKNRVKAIRLRGQISQGVLYRYDKLEDLTRDYAPDLGVSKWIPPIPAHLAGETLVASGIHSYTEIENIKAYPNLFQNDELVVATEKAHGTCFVSCLSGEDFYVSSKGMAKKGLGLKDVHADDGRSVNAYWRIAHQYRIEEMLREIRASYDANTKVALFGEITGVQDLRYGLKYGELGFGVFDIKIEDTYLSVDPMNTLIAKLGLPGLPIIYRGKFDLDAIKEAAEGKEAISGTEAHVREGVVVKPLKERYDPNVGRLVLKLINETYLFRKGETSEYE